MTTQHTPGPWSVADRRDGDCSTVTSPTGPVCKTYWTHRVPEMRANAHLIAAAPEMHAALQQCLANALHRLRRAKTYVDAEGSPSKADVQAEIDAIRAAITKAEGRQ